MRDLGESNELEYMVIEANKELDKLNAELQKWQTLITANLTIKERLENVEMRNYLEEVLAIKKTKKLRELEK